jgi:hypothetical protein
VAAAWSNRGQPFGYLMEWPWWPPNQALGLDLPAADILRTIDWQVRARLRDRIIIRRELPRSEVNWVTNSGRQAKMRTNAHPVFGL